MDDELTPEELEFLDLYMYEIGPAKASTSKASTSKASASNAEVDPLATLNKDASASVDVTYRVVWTAGEPSDELSDALHSDPTYSKLAEMFPHSKIAALFSSVTKARPVGSIRITESTAGSGLSSNCQAQDAARSAPTQQPLPEGKIPCIAMFHRDTLGARCTCLYDTVTDSFGNFGEDDEIWRQEKGYKDYGYIDMSTKKWHQGSWVSVEDDNEKQFLFLSVEKGHGVPRSWRPNMVAKRVVGDGETKLSYEEGLRLGVDEDDAF